MITTKHAVFLLSSVFLKKIDFFFKNVRIVAWILEKTN